MTCSVLKTSLQYTSSTISRITALKLNITIVKSLWPCFESKSRDKYTQYMPLKFYGISSCIRHPYKPNQTKPHSNTSGLCCSYCNWEAPHIVFFQTGQCVTFSQGTFSKNHTEHPLFDLHAILCRETHRSGLHILFLLHTCNCKGPKQLLSVWSVI